MIYRRFASLLRAGFGNGINSTCSPSCSRRFLPSKADIADEEFIKSRTVVSNDHLTPEISLYLITPKCDLWFAKPEESEFENDPFWAIYWPGGQALSRYILDHKHLFEGKNVLDVGSGSGACAIAAAKCNSALVLANDIDKVSLAAIKLNARLNEVDIHLEGNDIIGRDIDSLSLFRNGNVFTPKWDVVLVGDMFYNSDFALNLFSWLFNLVLNGKLVLIGDPGRYALNEFVRNGKLVKVGDYPVAKDEHFGFSQASVWRIVNFKPDSFSH